MIIGTAHVAFSPFVLSQGEKAIDSVVLFALKSVMDTISDVE